MWGMPREVPSHPLEGMLFVTDFCSGLSRFVSLTGLDTDMALGATVAAPTSNDHVRTEDAYRSLLQLVVVCKCDSKLEAHKWEELGIALSDVTHPVAVDVLSAEDFTEGAKAQIQACIPSATVRLHTIPHGDRPRNLRDIVGKFWERIDRAGTAAGPTGP